MGMGWTAKDGSGNQVARSQHPGSFASNLNTSNSATPGIFEGVDTNGSLGGPPSSH